MKPLVSYDANYYKYPVSVSRGYYTELLSDINLSEVKKAKRKIWISHLAEINHSKLGKFVAEHFVDLSDLEYFESLATRYGIFLQRFFEYYIREKIPNKIRNLNDDKLKFYRMIENLSGKQYEYNDWLVLSLSGAIFGSIFFTLEREGVISRKIEAWYYEHSEYRECKICCNEFRVIDLPNWMYHGSNGIDNCCFQCEIVDEPTKEQLLNLIPQFIKSCGFIPNSEASPLNYSFSSRLNNEKWIEAIKQFGKMGTINHVKKHFGSWFLGLKESGSLPNGVLVTSRGIKCLADDGHQCLSLDEQFIDNWLYSNGIEHEREPHYPKHSILNPYGRRRADWKIGDYFVEYFGLAGNPSYDRKTLEKTKLALAENIKLITILPNQINELDKIFKPFL